MRQVIARVAHEIPQRAPLRLEIGERVTAGKRDTHWPAFVFVTAAGGEGWVPARCLSAASGEAVVQRPYDTTELPTQAGEVLQVVEEDTVGEWLWCRDRNGREGWVPWETVGPQP